MTQDLYKQKKSLELNWEQEYNENGKYTASETLVIHPAPGNLNIPKHLQEISPQVRNFNYTEKRELSKYYPQYYHKTDKVTYRPESEDNTG